MWPDEVTDLLIARQFTHVFWCQLAQLVAVHGRQGLQIDRGATGVVQTAPFRQPVQPAADVFPTPAQYIYSPTIGRKLVQN